MSRLDDIGGWKQLFSALGAGIPLPTAITAAAARVPPALFDQLAEGGILVIPTGGLDMQMLATVRRANGQPQHRALCGCRFVPLVGAQAWPEPR